MLVFHGVTVIETRIAGVTVNVVQLETVPNVAVMFVAPVARLLARPFVLPLLLTVATLASEELHRTLEVRSCVQRSVKVPVAVNCWFVPSGMAGIAGVIAMDTNCAAPTVRVVDPVIGPRLAEIVVPPRPTLAARPVVEIVVTLFSDDDHVTTELKSWVLPSL